MILALVSMTTWSISVSGLGPPSGCCVSPHGSWFPPNAIRVIIAPRLWILRITLIFSPIPPTGKKKKKSRRGQHRISYPTEFNGYVRPNKVSSYGFTSSVWISSRTSLKQQPENEEHLFFTPYLPKAFPGNITSITWFMPRFPGARPIIIMYREHLTYQTLTPLCTVKSK